MRDAESPDWDVFGDGPAASERGGVEAGEPWCTCRAAGLQFYDYGRWDDVLERRVLPGPGDRLGLVRRPDNAADTHAVELWWRDGHMLGHLPRDLAAELAPRLDAGMACRAYVSDPGRGGAWQLRVLLVGAAVEPVHGCRAVAAREAETQAATRSVWGEVSHRWQPYAGPRAWTVLAAEEVGPRERPNARRMAAAQA